MHCFQFRVRFIRKPDPNLAVLAEDFYEEEKTACAKLLTISVIPLFRVKLLYKDASEKETILFHELAKTVEDLQKEVKKS